jgi:Carboxypeptidase regulatory-like domain/TonB dependent receptor
VDQTGAMVPSVTVTATNVATGVNSTTESSSTGAYNFPALQSGVYTVSVKQAGFKNLVHDKINVTAASVIGLDLALEVGDVGQTVSVSSDAPLLQTETSSAGTTIDNRAFVDLPLSSAGGRKANGYLPLIPGYAGSPGGFTDTINGGQASTKEMQLEGASLVVQEITGDGRNVTFPPDAVQEMSVATSGYSAEYGNTGGGVERYALKSGTNQLHGNAYEFLRNEAFDARGFFNTVTAVHREHEFGATLGGPVVLPKLYNGRNKTFFFYSFNGYTFAAANRNAILSTPTQAFRDGDFSPNPQQIYDPATTVQNADGSFTRQPFPGNIIPAIRIDPTAKAIQALFPLPQLPGISNNYNATVPPNSNERWTHTLKGDHNFNSSHHLSASGVITLNPQTAAGTGLPYPIGGQLDQPFNYRFARITYDWTLKPSMLNQFRYGYNWQRQNVDPLTRLDGWPQKLGLKGMELAAGMFPNISIGSSVSSTGAARPYTDRASSTNTFSDALSWSKGSHNFKFGFEQRRLLTTYVIQQNLSALTLSRNETARPGSLSTTGLEYASFLLGQVDSALLPLRGDFFPKQRTGSVAFYAQDDFRVSSRLTLNYGLRLDILTPTTEAHNWYSMIDTQKPNPFAGNLPGVYVFAGQNGVGNRIGPADKISKNLGPRVGLAYKLNDKTVIRAGYGISYFQSGAFGGGNNTNLMDGYWVDNTAASQDQLSPAYTLAQGFPTATTIVPPFLSPRLGVGTGVSVNYWNPTAGRASNSQNWNLNVQSELSKNLSIDIGYVGSKGTYLPVRTDINQLNPKYFALGSSLLNSNISAPAVVAAGYKPPYPGFNGSLAQALRPFPQFFNMFPGGKSSDTTGNSTYHSLQVYLSKRYSHGLFASVAYTYSKSLTNAPNNFVNNASVDRDIYDSHLSKTYPSNWRPHVVAIAFNYELPVGPGKPLLGWRGAFGKIIGGWQLDGILRYSSGSPLGVSAPQSNPLYNGSVGIVGGSPAVAIPQTADTVLGQRLMGSWSGKFNPATDRWLNPAAFAIPAGVFGTSNTFIPGLFGPAFLNEDVGLVKKTKISERVSLDIRFEAFNALNRTIFGNPATSLASPTTFGKITSASGQRNGQVAAKLTF